MSGIYIKGMEIPESCHKCEFVDILPTCPCNQMADEDFWNNTSLAVEGHKDCPLVPVPEHDGPLVDALDVINAFPDEFIFTNEQARALTNYIIPADPAKEVDG